MVAETTIVVPCFNESRRLPRDRFLGFIEATPDVSFVFVNDGSTDATQAVLESLVAERPERLRVIALPKNVGKAEAVRQGVLSALDGGSTFVGFWDADLATPLDAIPVFIDTFRRRPSLHVVFGARLKLLGREIHRRAIRHYLGRVFATAASLTLGLGVYDTQCGAKIFRATPVVRNAFGERFESRWIFDVELFDRMARDLDVAGDADASKYFYELPLLRWEDVAGSSVRGRDFLRAGLDLARIRWSRSRRARR